MVERQPQSAQNVANQYDDDAMVPADADAVIPWAEARGRLAEGRSFWWATTRRDGRPHVRPVLAVLLDDVIYSTTNRTARKAKNLAANPACSITTAAPATSACCCGRARRSWPGWSVGSSGCT